MNAERPESAALQISTGAIGRVLVLRLGAEADICRSLEEMARRENIRSGVILSGIGNLRRVALRCLKDIPQQLPASDDNRLFVTKAEAMELIALTGSVFQQDGKVQVHAHAVVSSASEGTRAYGGHLMEGTITVSLGQIVVAEIDGVQLVR